MIVILSLIVIQIEHMTGGTIRENIHTGLKVAVIQKQDQRTGVLTHLRSLEASSGGQAEKYVSRSIQMHPCPPKLQPAFAVAKLRLRAGRRRRAHGIKVRLTTGEVGRVQQIIDTDHA